MRDQLAVVRQDAGQAEVAGLRSELEAVQRKVEVPDAAVSAAPAPRAE